MSRTLEVFEHGTLNVSDGADGLKQYEFEALVRFNDQHERCYFDVGHRRITMKHFVGYLEVGELAIVILPKADKGTKASNQVWRDGLLEMLRIGLGLRLEHPTAASQSLARFRMLDVIALGFVAEVESLLHHGLARGYRTDEANGAVFRGRLKISEHIRDNSARADRFFVEYQTYDHDVVVNRLLAAALHMLEWCALSPTVASRVGACVARFPEVRTAGVTSALFDRARLTRSTQRYEQALVYARMILAQLGPQLQVGRARVFSLLFDMNKLWERYVAALFRRAAVPGIVISTQEQRSFWDASPHATRSVRPDIVVRREATSDTDKGDVVLVVDTKWKVPSKGLPSDEDLKQMFVYNELLGGVRSILMYPATEASFAFSGIYVDRKHTCEQFYLGVLDDKGWSTNAMRAHLGSLLTEVAAQPLVVPIASAGDRAAPGTGWV